MRRPGDELDVADPALRSHNVMGLQPLAFSYETLVPQAGAWGGRDPASSCFGLAACSAGGAPRVAGLKATGSYRACFRSLRSIRHSAARGTAARCHGSLRALSFLGIPFGLLAAPAAGLPAPRRHPQIKRQPDPDRDPSAFLRRKAASCLTPARPSTPTVPERGRLRLRMHAGVVRPAGRRLKCGMV
jgi:hypothetical protein